MRWRSWRNSRRVTRRWSHAATSPDIAKPKRLEPWASRSARCVANGPWPRRGCSASSPRTRRRNHHTLGGLTRRSVFLDSLSYAAIAWHSASEYVDWTHSGRLVMVTWEIQGRELVNCNCSYGCPCQFNAPPTQGYCAAVGSFCIDKGHFGDVPLDGLASAMAVRWPGPIHERRGQCQLFIDAKASPQQRDALLAIMSGK